MTLSQQYFWSHIVGGATDGLLPLLWRFQPSCQPKIPHLEFHVLGDEEISQLEVPVQDASLVQVLEAGKNLPQVVANLWLQQGVSGLPDVGQGLSTAKLQKNVYVVSILKVVREAHDMAVLQVSVQFNLVQDLLALMRLGDTTLRDDFDRVGAAGLCVGGLVAAGEAPLPNKRPLK